MYRRLVLMTSMSLSLTALRPLLRRRFQLLPLRNLFFAGAGLLRGDSYYSYPAQLLLAVPAVLPLGTVLLPGAAAVTQPSPRYYQAPPTAIAGPPAMAGTVIATRGGAITMARATSAGNNRVGGAGATTLTGVASTMVVVSRAGATVRSGNRQAAHPAPLMPRVQ